MPHPVNSRCGLASLFLALLVTFARAAPSPPNLVYPLQAQLPPVARVHQTFTWSLLPGTFNASSGSTLALSSRSLPSWCDFDAVSETFTGLPGTEDLGQTVVTVTANVSGLATGQSDSFTLLVLDPAEDPAPYVRLPLADQLASAAAKSGGGTLTPDGALKVPPQWSFSFGFQQYTFETASGNSIFYQAHEEGTTSLPSWMSFENGTVTFDGLAPLTEGEHLITLFGSDRYGYGDVQQTLKIVVAQHSFELLGAMAAEVNGSTVLPDLLATPGGPVSYTIPLSDFRIDNSSIIPANLTSVQADFAFSNLTFLSLDFPSLTITGDIPSTFETSELHIPLTFVDQYNSSLQTNLTLSITPSIFDASLFPQTINVQQGKPFSQSLIPFFDESTSPSSSRSRRSRSKRASNRPDATFTASISPSEASQWLSFSPTDLTLSGTAPSSIPSYENATVEILAAPLSSSSSSAISRAQFIFAVVSSATNTTTTHPHHPGSHQGLSHSAQLGLGLGLGLGGGLILLGLLVFCCLKKRKERNAGQGEKERKMRRDTSQQLGAYSPNPATEVSTLVASQGGSSGGQGGEKMEKEATRSSSGGGGGGLAPPIPGSEGMALPFHLRQQNQQHRQSKPSASRFGMMGALFRSESGWSTKLMGKAKTQQGAGGARKEDVSYPRPALPADSSLFGLGIDGEDQGDQPQRVVIISGGDDTDGRRTTYRENSDGSRGGAQTPSSSEGAASGSRRGPAVGRNGRVSSWQSGGSSSLFYSDRSGSAASPAPSSPHSRASPAPSSRNGQNRPPSIPYRRRDFLPLPIRSPNASPNSSPVPSPTRETYDITEAEMKTEEPFYRHEASLKWDVSGGSGSGSGSGASGGIRIVGSHSGSSGAASGPYEEDGVGELPHVGSFQQYSSPSHSGSYPSTTASAASLAPRLVPFTNRRQPPPFTRHMTSQSSLRARGLDPAAVEDAENDFSVADEGDWHYEEEPSGVSAVSSNRRATGIRPGSGVYHGEGERETSVVYYGSDAGKDVEGYSIGELDQPRETWRSPSGFADSLYSYDGEPGELLGEEGGMRYVGSVASTSAGPSPFLPTGSASPQALPPTPRSDVFSRHSNASQTTAPTPTSAAFSNAPFRTSTSSAATRPSFQHKRQSSYRRSQQPITVPINVNVPFRFTPKLASPPFVALSSSPGRGGPPRATYHAFVEYPAGPEQEEDEREYEELPDWLHFSGEAMEMFGLARRGDVGVWTVAVVERKALRTPGSPTRSGNGRLSPEKEKEEWEDGTEMVVGRFELVVDFPVGIEGGGSEESGELRVVTY
ncbi:hypothetical protein JCM11641_002715 [Rhodosporidiobolus odoratus]